MSDADIDEQQASPPAGTESGKGGAAGGDGPPRGPSPYRKPALAVARAIVVLAIAGVGYAVVIPTHHDRETKVVDSRLANLTVAETGISGFKTKPTDSGVQADANVGIDALSKAAKKSPGRTGLYSKDWTSSVKGSKDAVGLVVFLLPTQAQAETVLDQVSKTELSAKAQSANSLKRTGTFTLDGLPGSSGSVFVPTKPTKTSQDLVVAIFREGKVVTFVQAARSSSTDQGGKGARSWVSTVAKAQDAHLRTVEPGFSLIELVRPAGTSYPTVASIVWIVGSFVVVLLAALGPLAFGRARRRRRERLQAELDRMIVVRGQTITKRRR